MGFRVSGWDFGIELLKFLAWGLGLGLELGSRVSETAGRSQIRWSSDEIRLRPFKGSAKQDFIGFGNVQSLGCRACTTSQYIPAQRDS